MNDLQKQIPNPFDDFAGAMVEPKLQDSLDRIGVAIVSEERPAAEPTRPRRRRIVAAGFAVVVFAIALAAIVGPGVERKSDSAWAAADLRYAQTTPELLLEREGWRVSSVQQYPAGGEMEFKGGKFDPRVGLFWVRREYQPSLIKDRAHQGTPINGLAVAGQPVKAFYDWSDPYNGPDGTAYSAFWTEQGKGVRIELWLEGKPTAAQQAKFKSYLADVKHVSTEKWLSAIPDDYLLPGELPGATREILSDAALPPGYDMSAVPSSLTVATRRQLATLAFIDLECRWLDRWDAARKRGDRKTMREVTRAVSEYKNWKHIIPRKTPDGYTYYMGGEYYDALKTDGVVTNRLDDGSVIKRNVLTDYSASLGCGKAP